MKSLILPLLLICLLPLSIFSLTAQTSPLSSRYRSEVVAQVAQLLTDYYVFPDLAEQVAEHILKQDQAGHFEAYNDLASFSTQLTASIYEITRDKHLVVSQIPTRYHAESEPQEFEARLGERAYYRNTNAGFKSVEKLPNNIGYLNLRGFYGLDLGKPYADRAMAMLATSDAIIIDLRENRGGRGDMVEYLLGHFFESSIIASKTTKRVGDEFIEQVNWTPEQPKDKLMVDVPLFVLLASETISAAEGFSFALQIHERATFIGETTAGAANPGDLISLNQELQLFVSDVSVTHPENQTSWEGIGIIPDLGVDQEQALEVAIEEATRAALQHQEATETAAKNSLIQLQTAIQDFGPTSSPQKIIRAYLACQAQDIFYPEWELNNLGYQYLADSNHTHLGEAILAANV
ncbi:MAG: S41 family peptidase, partial [Bacteroidota bacterium]